ncbi:MAG TPA: glycosyl transferase family 2 [Elusimicrobia bacterium]|nr:glycosyl transferase family 2 [Elusimicrobiota bacterium]
MSINPTPKVSVIMAAHNEEHNISRTIKSILNQTFSDFEFIIINDGSTDKTDEIIKKYRYEDKRIHIISKENTGLADSLNIGIQHSSGEYIARMDADDVADEKRLEIQVNYLDNNPEIVMVGSWCYLIDLDRNIRIECKPPILNEDIRKHLQKDNPFIHSSVMMRKSVINKVGGYDRIQRMEDYDLWVRITKDYKVANIPMFLITRYENRNFYTRYYYNGLSRLDIYSKRLRYQLKAVRNFGLFPETFWYLSRTVISILLCKLGIR